MTSTTLKPGDVVTSDFMGVTGSKRRPSIVVSTVTYHAHRPDVILCLLTTQISRASASTDYLLQDWSQAGLRQASTARCFLATIPATETTLIGQLSDRDWQEVQARLEIALAVP